MQAEFMVTLRCSVQAQLAVVLRCWNGQSWESHCIAQSRQSLESHSGGEARQSSKSHPSAKNGQSFKSCSNNESGEGKLCYNWVLKTGKALSRALMLKVGKAHTLVLKTGKALSHALMLKNWPSLGVYRNGLTWKQPPNPSIHKYFTGSFLHTNWSTFIALHWGPPVKGRVVSSILFFFFLCRLQIWCFL